MYAGNWAGTMCMTEAHCGTDLGIMRTKANDNGDGSYEISGNKIFISSGEHDLTENIIHLVLARLADSPSGSRGLSLFLVPKFLVNQDGSLGNSNNVSCGSVEHKMGIHGSATCVMNFDGAKGYIIGEKNKGLAAMFTMMNYQRLSVGGQGLGASHRSYINALAYAKDRLQGRAATGKKQAESIADPIIHHADVRRMLLNMKSLVEAGRAFSTYVASKLDCEKYSENEQEKTEAQGMVSLLTPIAKAFLSDMGLDICVQGQQIFGGHGYVREWGQEQLVRDVRIAQIYEGTNGIQALDLLGRKITADKGRVFFELKQEITTFFELAKNCPSLTEHLPQLYLRLNRLSEVTLTIIDNASASPNEVGAASTEYLHAFGYLMYAYMWAKMVVAAEQHQAEDPSFAAAKIKTANYYFKRVLPRIDSLLTSVIAGADPLYMLDADEF
jgi:alkylation response protein AidB-like acyl-CoA dehydrogenase